MLQLDLRAREGAEIQQEAKRGLQRERWHSQDDRRRKCPRQQHSGVCTQGKIATIRVPGCETLQGGLRQR